MTFGNISKLYSFSTQKLQSQIAREFNEIYGFQLTDTLNVLTKYRNACAHGERLYNYRTQSSFSDLPFHLKHKGQYNKSKNDLFNVCIAFKYLLSNEEFKNFIDNLDLIFKSYFERFDDYYRSKILKSMGFPSNWKTVLTS